MYLSRTSFPKTITLQCKCNCVTQSRMNNALCVCTEEQNGLSKAVGRNALDQGQTGKGEHMGCQHGTPPKGSKGLG